MAGLFTLNESFEEDPKSLSHQLNELLKADFQK